MYEAFKETVPSRVIAAYADFEKEIRNIISPICGPICATCNSVCCQYDFCNETLESPFYYLVAEGAGCLPKSSMPAPDAGPFALSPHGCTITAGRSKFCSAFTCSKILRQFRSDHESYAFKCISDMLLFLTADFSGKRPLDEIKDTRLFTEARFEKLLRKINLARDLLAAALFLFKGGHKLERVETTAKRLLFLATHFPFTGLPKGRSKD